MTIFQQATNFKALGSKETNIKEAESIRESKVKNLYRDHCQEVNDVHSKLNETKVSRVFAVTNKQDIVDAVLLAKAKGRALSVCGGRHAMGGQQFTRQEWLLDMNAYKRVLHFDHDKGQTTVQSGIQWPDLMRQYHQIQHDRGIKWGISQKQTGADRLSIGGAIAANIHGRGLLHKPFIEDVVAFTLINAEGEEIRCSRTESTDLFSRVIGGYGLFGIVAEVTLQLKLRQKVKRVVEALDIADLIRRKEERINEGAIYGDFQFAIDATSDEFLTKGIFSCYLPVDDDTQIPRNQVRLTKPQWMDLLALAHQDKTGAFHQFRQFYLRSNNQVYWSDTHQLSIYLDDYHEALDERMGASCPGSEMISELYVPQDKLLAFMGDCKTMLRELRVDIVYGTVRFIKQDDESELAWAKDDYACIIFNVHTDHNQAGINKSKTVLKQLIDVARQYQGSYFLTYHRYADKEQVLDCYPQLPRLLAEKLEYDPKERFQSDWYRHYKAMFAGQIRAHRQNKQENN